MGSDNFTFEFTTNEINTVLAGLGQLPFNQVFELVNKIQRVAQEQLAANKAE
jgi:hypothetical protein